MEVFSKLCQATVSFGGSCFRSYLNRFLSADTIVPDPTNPQSFNRYSYGYNNPVKYSDPSGHIACNTLGTETCQTDNEGNPAEQYVDPPLSRLQGGDAPVSTRPVIGGKIFGDSVPTAEIRYWLDFYAHENGLNNAEYSRQAADAYYKLFGGLPPGFGEGSGFSELIRPDAFIAGASGNAAGFVAGVVGGEELINLRNGDVSGFTYSGQGGGLVVKANVTGYIGFVWNLEENVDYEGSFFTLTADLSLVEGGQINFFWSSDTIPFTGETWGFSVGKSTGGGAGISGTVTDFTCQHGCR